jgi:hypothetical protein
MVSANYAGDYEPQGAIIIQSKKTGAAIAKGDICDTSSGSWRTAPAGAITYPFAVCTKAATAADATVQLLIQGIVYVTSAGAITINTAITGSGATAGQAAQTATPGGSSCVGWYLAHENEGDGVTVPTDAVNGDVIRVRFGVVC